MLKFITVVLLCVSVWDLHVLYDRLLLDLRHGALRHGHGNSGTGRQHWRHPGSFPCVYVTRSSPYTKSETTVH